MVSDQTILDELATFAAREDGAALWLFRSPASARQYLPIYDLLRRHVSPGARVLDWGAGSGHLSYFLWRSGYETTSYRLLDDSADAWLRDTGIVRVMGKGEDPVGLPFPEASFDAVVSLGVLEHVGELGGNVAGSLAELRRVTRDGGRFLCGHLPNRFSWIEAAARRVPGRYSHPLRFTRHGIAHELERARFDLLEIERYGLLPRNLFAATSRGCRQHQALTVAWDHLDQLGSQLLPWICQNFRLAARAMEAG